MGVVSTNEGNFNIVFDTASGNHIYFNDKNLIEQNAFDCSPVEDKFLSYESDVLFGKNNNILMRSITYNLKYVRLYFETEFDIYQARGNSISNVEAFVTGLHNQVATLYRNEDIFTQLSEIHIWTTEDPYTETNTADLLTKFQNTRTSINGDLGQLITFRNVGGGRAVVSGLCNSKTRNKFGVCGIHNFFNNAPNYSWSVFAITHEFGHLLGSQHTHKCVWNGNNTAIDGCGTIEGTCSRPPSPTAGGTIMSYCHNDPVGINFNLGFGPQPGNVIRNTVNGANCLQSHTINFTGDTEICDVGNHTYTLNGLPSDIPITWSSSNDAMTFVSSSGNSAVFKRTGFGNCEIRASLSPFRSLVFPVTICQPSISGPSTLCDQATYTINNLPQGATVEWSADQPLNVFSGQGTNNVVIINEDYGTSYGLPSSIFATITVGNTNFNINKTVHAGVPEFDYFDYNDDQVHVNSVVTVDTYFSGANYYTWTKKSGDVAISVAQGNTSRAMISIFSSKLIRITVTAFNDCGSWEEDLVLHPIYNTSSFQFSISPNPATSSVTISLEEKEDTEGIQSYSALNRNTLTASYTIQLWNSYSLVKSVQTDLDEYKMDLHGIPAGFYYVLVIKDGQTYRKQLMVK